MNIASENGTTVKGVDIKSRIRKIEGDKIFIHDIFDNKEYEYTNKSLKDNSIEFKKLFIIF